MTLSPDHSTPRRHHLLLWTFRLYASLLIILLPLKFGSVLFADELADFPNSIWQWLMAGWPPFLFSMLAGIALLLAILAQPRLPTGPPARLYCRVALLWTALLVSSSAGLIHSTELDYAWRFLWYLAGVCSLSWAATLMLPYDPKLRNWLLGALVVATLLTAYDGWQQIVFGGFAQTRALLDDIAAQTGKPVQAQVLARLLENRAFGPFVYPNSYAGYLILTMPIVLVVLWRCGTAVAPAKVSRPLFAGIGLVIIGAALWFSLSRAAILALGLAVPAIALLEKASLRPRWRLATAILALAVALGIGLAANQGRRLFGSLEARLVYYQAALHMTTAQPLTGVGLGEFFPHYMRLKPAGAEETRQPHNLVLAFSSQAGVIAGLLAALVLALPFLLEIGRPKITAPAAEAWLWRAGQVGLLAWGIHALLDFHLQIPALVGTAAIVPLLVQAPPEPGPTTLRRRWLLLPLALAAASAGVLWPGTVAYQHLTTLIDNPRSRATAVVAEHARHTAAYWPYSAAPWVKLARWAEAHQQPILAIDAWREAVRRAPHRAAYHYYLAINLHRHGDMVAARAALDHALYWYPLEPRNQQLAERLHQSEQ